MTAPLFDPDQQRAAARIERDHPQWLIVWGAHTRLFWAYPRFQAPTGTMVAAPDTAELTARMQQIELASSAHMPPRASQPRGNDSA
jgi:hypothetical protein